MSDRQIDTDRLVFDALGTEDEIFGAELKYGAKDLLLLPIAFLVGFAGLQVGKTVAPPLGWALFALPMIGALGAIFLSPSHRRPHHYLADVARFATRPKDLSLFSDTDREQTESVPLVDRVLPVSDGVRRTDGALVGGVDISPTSMALADDAEWETATDRYAAVLNGLEHKTVWTAGGRPVPPELITTPYEDRLTDRDGQTNDELRSLLLTYSNEFKLEFFERGTSVKQYGCYTPVTVADVQLKDRDAVQKVGRLRGIGGVLQTIGAEANRMTDAEIVDEQKQTLDERLRSVETGIADIPGVSAERMSGDALGDAIDTHWSSTERSRRWEMGELSPDEVSRFADAIGADGEVGDT